MGKASSRGARRAPSWTTGKNCRIIAIFVISEFDRRTFEFWCPRCSRWAVFFVFRCNRLMNLNRSLNFSCQLSFRSIFNSRIVSDRRPAPPWRQNRLVPPPPLECPGKMHLVAESDHHRLHVTFQAVFYSPQQLLESLPESVHSFLCWTYRTTGHECLQMSSPHLNVDRL